MIIIMSCMCCMCMCMCWPYIADVPQVFDVVSLGVHDLPDDVGPHLLAVLGALGALVSRQHRLLVLLRPHLHALHTPPARLLLLVHTHLATHSLLYVSHLLINSLIYLFVYYYFIDTFSFIHLCVFILFFFF